MKQASPFAAYYYPLLRPGYHYEPLYRNLSDTCSKVSALASELQSAIRDEGARGRTARTRNRESFGTQSRAERLAAAATLFARQYLAPSAVAQYVAVLLRQYAALQKFQPRLHPHAVLWDPTHSPSTTAQAAGHVAKMGTCSSASCCARHPKACNHATSIIRSEHRQRQPQRSPR